MEAQAGGVKRRGKGVERCSHLDLIYVSAVVYPIKLLVSPRNPGGRVIWPLYAKGANVGQL